MDKRDNLRAILVMGLIIGVVSGALTSFFDIGFVPSMAIGLVLGIAAGLGYRLMAARR